MRGSAPVLTALLLPAALGPGSAPRRAAAVPVRRRHGSAPPRCMQMRCKSLPGKRAGERRYATTPSAPCMQMRSTPAAARAARSGNTAIGRGPAANETARKKISREPAGAGPGRKQRRAGGGGRGGGRKRKEGAAAARRMLRLRCKARSGTQPLPGLTAHSRLRDMQAALAALTGVPAPAQRLLLGFPPRSLDLSDGERRLGELGIHSGEACWAAAPALYDLRCPAGCN